MNKLSENAKSVLLALVIQVNLDLCTPLLRCIELPTTVMSTVLFTSKTLLKINAKVALLKHLSA